MSSRTSIIESKSGISDEEDHHHEQPTETDESKSGISEIEITETEVVEDEIIVSTTTTAGEEKVQQTPGVVVPVVAEKVDDDGPFGQIEDWTSLDQMFRREMLDDPLSVHHLAKFFHETRYNTLKIFPDEEPEDTDEGPWWGEMYLGNLDMATPLLVTGKVKVLDTIRAMETLKVTRCVLMDSNGTKPIGITSLQGLKSHVPPPGPEDTFESSSGFLDLNFGRVSVHERFKVVVPVLEAHTFVYVYTRQVNLKKSNKGTTGLVCEDCEVVNGVIKLEDFVEYTEMLAQHHKIRFNWDLENRKSFEN